MNYLTFIKQVSRYNPMSAPINFLVSGNDVQVRNIILTDIYNQTRNKGRKLVILDDSGNPGMLNIQEIMAAGYTVKNGMSGEYCFYNPLQINNIKGMSRLRQLLGLMEYNEKQKQKLLAYLNFIRHLESLSGADANAVLTFDILSSYSSNMFVEMKIQNLLSEYIINSEQQLYLLSKYSEVCDAAADFENTLYILAPYIMGEVNAVWSDPSAAFVFRLGELEMDMVMKNIVAKLLLYSLADAYGEEFTVVVLDRGVGKRQYILDFISALSEGVEIHILSEDVFTLGDSGMIQMLVNRFTARVYSRHLSMDSCLAIEKSLGEVDVVKQTYTVNYDRRWSANKPWDILWGNNKVEAYITNPPVREPRYRKEMIAGFQQGYGIIEYMGSSSVFSV